MRSEIMWAIIHKDGAIQINTLSWLRKEAVKKFLGEGRMTWKECQKYGWKATKVEVTIKNI